MTIVRNTLTAPDGSPLVNRTIVARLASDGFLPADAQQIISRNVVSTGIDGLYELDLAPQSAIDPTGTHYVIAHPDGTEWPIVVPDGAGPFWLRDILVENPAAPGAVIAGLSEAQATARYQPVPYTTWPAKAASVSIVGAGNRNPAWLSNDGTRVFCNSVNVLYWSDDEFSTIVTSIDMAAAGAAGSIQTVRETGDGELLLFMGSTTGSVWRTVGYLNGAAGPLAFTVVKVLDFLIAEAIVAPNWGVWVDPAEGIAAVMEYGTSKSGATSARYGYLSKDRGLTWTVFFDRYASIGDPVTTGLHPHGVAYDAISDVFLATGGDDTDYIAVCENWRTATTLADFTWRTIQYSTDVNGKFQSVGIYPLPNCILLVSDGFPNGVHRIDRINPDGSSWLTPGKAIIQNAYSLDTASSIRYLGGQMFKARHDPNAPLIIGMNSTSTVRDRSLILLTVDGYSFTEYFTEAQPYNTAGVGGIASNVGPTVANKRIFSSRRAGGAANDRLRLTMPDIIKGSPSPSAAMGYGRPNWLQPGDTRGLYASHLMIPESPMVTMTSLVVIHAAINQARGVRVMAPRTGRITFPHIYVGVSAGNIELALYSATNPRLLLWSSGALACPSAGWAQIASDTLIQCSAGDEFVWQLVISDLTATFARTSVAVGALGVLPAALGLLGSSHKLIEGIAASVIPGAAPASVAEGSLSSGWSAGPLVVARID